MPISHEQAQRLLHLAEEFLIIMASLDADVQAATTALQAQTAEIQSLQAQLAAAASPVSASDQAALEAATTAANAVLTPPAPAPVPVPNALVFPAQAIDAVAGAAINSTVTADGGTAPYGFSSTSLPTGVAINGDGVVTGTIDVPGTLTGDVDVTDAAGNTANGTVTFTITAVPPVAS